MVHKHISGKLRLQIQAAKGRVNDAFEDNIEALAEFEQKMHYEVSESDNYCNRFIAGFCML